MAVYISRDDSNALAHHGVKGMKWGVRHDKEPYNERKDIQRTAKLTRKEYTRLRRLEGSPMAEAFGLSMRNEAAKSKDPAFIKGVDKGLRSATRRENIRGTVGLGMVGGSMILIGGSKVVGRNAATAAFGIPMLAVGMGTMTLGSAIAQDVFGKARERAKVNKIRKTSTKKLKTHFLNEGSSIKKVSYNHIGVISGKERYKRV